MFISNNLFNRQSNSDVIKQLLTLVCCDITVRSNIVDTASSFSLSFGNLSSNCAFCKRIHVKWSERRTEYLLMRPGTSLKLSFIYSFLTLGSEGRQCKDCFSTTGTPQASSCLHSIFIVWFLCRPAAKQEVMVESEGRGSTSSDVELVGGTQQAEI